MVEKGKPDWKLEGAEEQKARAISAEACPAR